MRSIKLFEQFSNLVDKARLSESIVKMLNEQIKIELESSQLYRAMSCWLDKEGWISASKYFYKSAQEELTHMEKVYEYLFEKNCTAKTPACDMVKESYEDIKNILDESLEHEIKITKNWNDIADKALEEKDNDTYALAQWFLKEQKEEENKFRDIIFKARLDMPDWKIEELF